MILVGNWVLVIEELANTFHKILLLPKRCSYNFSFDVFTYIAIRGVDKGILGGGGCQPPFADEENFPQTKFAGEEGFPRVFQHRLMLLVYCKFAD